MTRKPFQNYETIFLDTGVLIDLLKIDLSKDTQAVQERITQTRLFFEAMHKADKNKGYQTSTINLAEIFHLDEKHESILKAVAILLKSPNFEIIAFDYAAALFHNKEFGPYLGKSQINELKKLVNYPTSIHANVEDRIRKDYMIATTAKMYGADLVLTNDSGFGVFCNQIGIENHVFTGDKGDFQYNQNDTIIYGFQ